jgi:hypothetical protein
MLRGPSSLSRRPVSYRMTSICICNGRIILFHLAKLQTQISQPTPLTQSQNQV